MARATQKLPAVETQTSQISSLVNGAISPVAAMDHAPPVNYDVRQKALLRDRKKSGVEFTTTVKEKSKPARAAETFFKR